MIASLTTPKPPLARSARKAISYPFRLFFCAFGCLLVTATHAADSWPQFRGPGGQGIAEFKTAPLKWSKDGPKKWRTELAGQAWSSPVLQDGKLYLSNAVETKGKWSLRGLCVDAESGKVLWDNEVFQLRGNGKIHKKNSHASPTPIVDGNRLFLHFGYQGTACLDLAGKVKWTNRDLDFAPTHGGGGSPALVEGMLVFHCDGGQKPSIAALDAKSGKLTWQTERSENAKRTFSFCTPLVIDVGGRKQIISPASDAVFAYSLDGKEIWKVKYPGGYSVVPRPLYAHGLVFVSSGFDVARLYAIRPNGKGDVTKTHVAWSARKNISKSPSFIVVGNELYVQADNGVITCFDAKTGKQHYQQRAIGSSTSSPSFAGGRIYFHDEAGKTAVISPGKTFVKLAENDLGERTLATPAFSEGRMYLRTGNALYCFEGDENPLRSKQGRAGSAD
jgi:outer membrane protein assembly factor BamB